MNYIKRINRKYIIILISIVICLNLLNIILPNKIPIRHELINDNKLNLGESNYDISANHELLYESEYAYNNHFLNDDILNNYENRFNCNIESFKSCFFFSGGIIRLFQRLNKFEISLIIESEVSSFKKLTNYLLEKAISDNGKKYKTRFETKFSKFIWEFDNYNFIISIYHNGFFHYDLDKQKIDLTWKKDSNEF